MRVTIHNEMEPPECRPCPPLPLHGPILLEVAVPTLSLGADPHSAAPIVPVSGDTSPAPASKSGNKHKPPVCESRGLVASATAKDPRIGNTPRGWLAMIFVVLLVCVLISGALGWHLTSHVAQLFRYARVWIVPGMAEFGSFAGRILPTTGFGHLLV
ncbi:hypothetical protein B0H19DRAFT_1381593 [Mycena capillaripes]|nr:hypothetical protein B0H19DRAFT_1381593 [Mycena capillaripes]